MLFFGPPYFIQDGVGYRGHHRCCRRVGYEHRQHRSYQHEPQHDPPDRNELMDKWTERISLYGQILI